MNWWQRLLRRKKMEEQLEKELRFHLDQHTAELIARGDRFAPRLVHARTIFDGGSTIIPLYSEFRATSGLPERRRFRSGVREWSNIF